MKKFVPYSKMSKSKRKEIDKARRATWGELNPTTRKEKNLKAYNRKKFQKSDLFSEDFGISFFVNSYSVYCCV